MPYNCGNVGSLYHNSNAMEKPKSVRLVYRISAWAEGLFRIIF